ncbi:hypothetical protein [Microbacterium rhizomatis]|uniref:Uncharacterized protein n=1 Tax=Microbacterium rhizomatis TaxID=1631477 RepID=A0A5J5J2W7_9MICO|nr:hypothetical protein [Microbacterium rhizomatis]KAA9107518.1 hypothetical protein F6B43_08570 [Microbacterium rhizomatis]
MSPLTPTTRARYQLIGIASGLVIATALLAGCTTTPRPAAAGIPDAQIGQSQDCPGEFLQYLAKERTINAQDATVEELPTDTATSELGFTLPDTPLCAATTQGQRTLPSGATEPAEHTLLIPGAHKTQIDGAAREAGYTDGAGWTLLTDTTVLRITEKTGTQIGIPDTTTYTLLTTTNSPELAKLKIKPSQ